MDNEDLMDPLNVTEHVLARMKNVGAVFKGATLGLFNIARDAKASLAVRTEASLMAVRRSGELPDYPTLNRFEQSLADPKTKQHAMLGDITVSMPEFAAQNLLLQHPVAWHNEEDEDEEDGDEEHGAQPAENTMVA